MSDITIEKNTKIEHGSALWRARFADRFINTNMQNAMYCITHTDKEGEPIFDSYGQSKYFALDQEECNKVLTHLWDEFGTRGYVAVNSLHMGPEYYFSKLNANMVNEFTESACGRAMLENIKLEFWEGDISMSELLVDERFNELSDSNIEELLAWAGEDEYCNVEDIREGQSLVNEDRDLDQEQEI